MNSVQLLGNLTRDPEDRELPSGKPAVNLRLAVNGRRKTADGGWEEVPNYFTVSAYDGLAETCTKYLESGRKIAVTGRLHYRAWDTDDGKRSTVEIVATEVDFLSNGRGPAETEAAEAALA